jgi:hypothetical protein
MCWKEKPLYNDKIYPGKHIKSKENVNFAAGKIANADERY